MFLAVRFERFAYECPFRISACVFLRIIAGYNLGLMEWERSPEVDKLKFGAAEHRYFAGAC